MSKNDLIAQHNPKSPASEAYRMIRTNLEYAGVTGSKKVILITSALAGEGKTTTLTNLAVTLAHSGLKILVVDADLRRPSIHKVFHIRKSPGLTNYLVKDIPVGDIIQKNTPLDQLHYMAAGANPPLASELLASQKMIDLLQQCRDEYDYILVDSPPLLSVTDASILATRVDGTILCIAQGKTNVEAVKAAKRSLDKVNASVLGAVLTKAEFTKGIYAYHYYDYQYMEDEEHRKRNWFGRKK